jgi:hypothetical protein
MQWRAAFPFLSLRAPHFFVIASDLPAKAWQAGAWQSRN